MSPAPARSAIPALRKAALRLPDVEESVACAGTALESASFKVGGKAFLFLRPSAAMLKLDASLAEAKAAAASAPKAVKVGAGGWVTVSLADALPVPQKKLEAWIAESRVVLATSKPSGGGAAAKPVPKRGTKPSR